jgi:hypothetical protein
LRTGVVPMFKPVRKFAADQQNRSPEPVRHPLKAWQSPPRGWPRAHRGSRPGYGPPGSPGRSPPGARSQGSAQSPLKTYAWWWSPSWHSDAHSPGLRQKAADPSPQKSNSNSSSGSAAGSGCCA